jgi:hypothetical protein
MDEGMAASVAKGFLARLAAVLVALGGEGTAGFQIGSGRKSWARSSGARHAGWETRDTAGLETCGTVVGRSVNFFTGSVSGCARMIW